MTLTLNRPRPVRAGHRTRNVARKITATLVQSRIRPVSTPQQWADFRAASTFLGYDGVIDQHGPDGFPAEVRDAAIRYRDALDGLDRALQPYLA
jgi:hypothetical protein